MARGDGGKDVFETDDDRRAFLFRLGQVGGSHGWRIHAWVLMGNHFHLLLETPQANLVSGMKYLMSTFSQGWNRTRQRRGHVFQGRYKSVPVTGTQADAYYFRIVADCIHLNPAGADLAGGKSGPLVGYKWSSLASYVKGNGPDWLVMDRVLRAFLLAQDGRGRRAYVCWLEARAANDEGKIDEAAMQAMRRGLVFGQGDVQGSAAEAYRSSGRKRPEREKPQRRRDARLWRKGGGSDRAGGNESVGSFIGEGRFSCLGEKRPT